jgi:hypothetical protein
MLNISALYLSQKRLNEVLDRVTLPVAARLSSVSAPENAGVHRTAILGAYVLSAWASLEDSLQKTSLIALT